MSSPASRAKFGRFPFFFVHNVFFCDFQDTFYLEHEEGVEPLLMRTHTSSVQIRALERLKPPLAIVAPGRVFRRDTPDSTHNPEFHQVRYLFCVWFYFYLSRKRGSWCTYVCGVWFSMDRY